MDGLQYCRERVLIPGARLSLTRHFIDSGLASKLVVLQAFYAEIATVPDRVSDSGVARNKLGWWQEEIHRCWQGKGRHPVSQAAVQQGITGLVSAEQLVRLVMAVADWIDAPPIATLDKLLSHCSAIGGMAARLEAQVCGADAQCFEAAGQLGTAHYLVALIRDIGGDARAERWYIPMDLQARYRFDRERAAAGESTAAFRELVAALTAVASELIEQAKASLSPPQRRQLRHLAIQSALDQQLIKKMRSNPDKILQQRIRLSPFASLWTVWRAAREPGVD